jgi:uncharacterized caspase-like protein
MVRRWVMGIVLCLLCPAGSLADGDDSAKWGRRTALVVGNGAYKTSPLPNPVSDARLISEALNAAHFRVIKVENASRESMLKAITEFGNEIDKGGVGLFYYAGHGVQVRGENYLMPVDVNVSREEEIRSRGVNAQEVLDRMVAAKNGLNLVFFDACRNDPFPRASRGAAQGLAKMDAALGMLVSFATAPGSVAEDGKSGNSPYTRHLADTIRQPGLRVEDVLKRVRSAVRRETEGRQITWDNSSIEGEFFFLPGEAQVALAAPVDAGPHAEVAFWNTIKTSSDPLELELYLKRYPDGEFAELARRRLRALGGIGEKPSAARKVGRAQVPLPNRDRAQARALFPRVPPEEVTDTDIQLALELKDRIQAIDEARARRQAALRSVTGGNSMQDFVERSWRDWHSEIDRAIAAKDLEQAEEEISVKEEQLGIESE